MKNQLYSEHLDTIVALVFFLGMTKDMTREPRFLAEKLSIDYDETLFVLQNFKGLFRESPSKKPNESVYDLQVRYAQGWLEEDKVDESPLEPKYMEVLLGFISNMVANEEAEKRQRSANRSATFGAWAAFGAAISAAVIGIVSIAI